MNVQRSPVSKLVLGTSLAGVLATAALAQDLGTPVPIPAEDPPAAAATEPAPQLSAPPAPSTTVKSTPPASRGGQEDIDLWAFSAVSALAPGKTLADFRALPNLAGETKDELRGSDDASTAANGPFGYRFTYADGLTVRVLDYGSQAFVTSLRLSGGDRALPNDLKLGMTRAQVEAVLGRPTRGGLSYAVYEGKTDVVRTFYANGALSKLEVDRGD